MIEWQIGEPQFPRPPGFGRVEGTQIAAVCPREEKPGPESCTDTSTASDCVCSVRISNWACSLGHSAHRFDRVKEQVENYLLQLKRGLPKTGGRLSASCVFAENAILCQFAAN